MKNSKINTVLLIIIIVLVLGIIWARFNTNKDEEREVANVDTYQVSPDQNTKQQIDTANWKQKTFSGITFSYPSDWSISENHDRLYGMDPNDKKVIGLTIAPPAKKFVGAAYPTMVRIPADQYSEEHTASAQYSLIIDGVYLGSATVPEDAYPKCETIQGHTICVGNGYKYAPELEQVYTQIVASVKKS